MIPSSDERAGGGDGGGGGLAECHRPVIRQNVASPGMLLSVASFNFVSATAAANPTHTDFLHRLSSL